MCERAAGLGRAPAGMVPAMILSEGGTVADTICAMTGCNCIATEGEFCSDYCREHAGETHGSGNCGCGHPGCG